MPVSRQTPNELILGLVSISDRASRGEYADEGIPALESWCKDAITTPLLVHRRLIADEQYSIEQTLRELVDQLGCDLVFTTGGTGPARRDVTPEATLAVGTRELPGFAEQMRRISLNYVPTAILSRQVAVLREIPGHAALIVNLPGRPKSIAETLGGFHSDDGEVIDAGLFASIPYCLDLIGGPYIETDPSIVEAFRPKTARRPEPAPAQRAEPAAAPRPAPAAPVPQPAAPAVASRPAAVAPQPAPTLTAERPRMSSEAIARRSVQHGVPLFSTHERPSIEPLKVLVQDPVNGSQAPCTVIWLHGMGANAQDFVPFAQELLNFGGPAARFIFPDAPRIALTAHDGWESSAWFNLLSKSFDGPEDADGIAHMHLRITQIINEIISSGVPAEKIFLGGFSQGAAMALYCGLRQARTLAGIISLSGYLPLARKLPTEMTPAGKATPVFMAHGAFDSVISPVIAKRSADIVENYIDTLIWREYNMDHELCSDEVTHIAQFMNTALQN